MKAVRYRDIKPSNRTNFLQVYHHACRTLTQIETKLKRAYGDPLPAGSALRLIRLSRKLQQMAARYKYCENELKEALKEKHLR